MAAALRLEDIPASSYYDFRHDHPGEDAALKTEAQALVAAEIDLERVRALRMREVQRLQIEELLLKGVAPVLKSLLADAKAAEGLHTRVAALRELRQWLDSSMLQSVSSSAAEESGEQLAAPRLPDFLSSGQVAEVSVKNAAGDEIILRRGEVIEGEELAETHRDVSEPPQQSPQARQDKDRQSAHLHLPIPE
jgi:hypothetical protein